MSILFIEKNVEKPLWRKGKTDKTVTKRLEFSLFFQKRGFSSFFIVNIIYCTNFCFFGKTSHFCFWKQSAVNYIYCICKDFALLKQK